VLLRSGLEIERILKGMLEDQDTLIASPQDDEVLFISRLTAVAPPEHIELACADHKLANSALLGAKKPHFHCSHRGLYYAFAAAGPREAQHGGALVIRLDFPRELLAQQRRGESRLRLPPKAATLRCDVSLGPLSFEAEIVDFSRSGMGMLSYDAGIRLQPGLRLEKVRVVNPGHAPVLVDMEIRHVAKVMLPDGRLAHRAGCLIHAPQQVMQDLARAFMIKLE
jgi:c-di-GMP-binding flagellar brake protein YcgR